MQRTFTPEQQMLLANFALLGEWTERYKYLIELGARLPVFPEEFKIEPFKVKGCLSQVWMRAQVVDGRVQFMAVSDSAIVSGLIAVLRMMYHDRTPEEILAIPTDFLDELDLQSHLSPTRNNGLYAMLTQIKRYAQHYLYEDQTS